MATKAQLLNSLSDEQLQALAEKHDVALSGEERDENIAELRASSTVRVADIQAFINEQEEQEVPVSSREDETTQPAASNPSPGQSTAAAPTEDDASPEDVDTVEEGGGVTPSSAEDVDPVVAAVADANTDEEEIEPPEGPPEPTTPIAFREPEQPAASPSQAPAVALAAGEDAEEVGIDERSGRIFRTTPGVLVSESAQSAGESTHEEEPQHITSTTWVVLGDLTGDLEKYSGREAAVVSAPEQPCLDPECTFSTVGPHMHQPEGTIFTVRTRDEDSALLNVTSEDFKEVTGLGRVGLPSAG